MSKVFREWKQGKLRIGKSNKIVKSHKQAIAIALSIAEKRCSKRRSKKQSKRKRSHSKRH